jgi:glycosyltransferase involved in cell wall biosynthesis
MLTAIGRINPATHGSDPTLNQLVRIVPFGIPAPPDPIGRPGPLRTRLRIDERDLLVLWGGGIYEWLDPLTLIEAAAAMDNAVKVFFLGTTPGTPAMPIGQRAMARSQELRLLNRSVFFGEGWVPYDERAAYLLDADVGVSLHRDHIEATFAFRTRILDYIWAGLPIVASDGDSWATLVRDRALGEVVKPGDVADTRQALLRLAHEGTRRACARAVRAVADEFRWDKVTEPLMEFCRHPQRAPDLLDPYQRLRARVDASERVHALLGRVRRSVTAAARRRR